ncbi:MAG: hypothetical protein R2826_06295, partial [Thermoleophilia bacterium]
WRPRLLDRSAWDAWEESGKRGSEAKAVEVAVEALSSRRVLRIPESVEAVLRADESRRSAAANESGAYERCVRPPVGRREGVS